jgi:hypothetical protein
MTPRATRTQILNLFEHRVHFLVVRSRGFKAVQVNP